MATKQIDKPDKRPRLPPMIFTFRCGFCGEASDVAVGGEMKCLSCGHLLSLDSVCSPTSSR